MDTLAPGYETENDWLLHRYQLSSGQTICLQAKDIRKTRTGTHAMVAITFDGKALTYDVFNIERREERDRLAKSAHRLLAPTYAQEFPEATLKSALDAFCYRLWDERQRAFVGTLTHGDPMAEAPIQLLGGYLVEGGGTIIFAPPGRGKSYIGLAMALSLDAGCDYLWRVQRRRVVFVNLERSERSIRWRLARVAACLGLTGTYGLAMLHKRGGTLAELEPAIRLTLDRHEAQVVVVDSLSRAGAGSLKEDDLANNIMDMLNRTAPTWLLLAHTPRGDESHMYGSVMLEAAADICIQALTQVKDDGTVGLGLEVTKANDIRRPKMAVYAMEFDSEGLTVLRPASTVEFPMLAAGRRQSLEETVTEYLREVGQASSAQIAEATGFNRNNVSLLVNRGEMYVRSGRDGKTPLYSNKALNEA